MYKHKNSESNEDKYKSLFSFYGVWLEICLDVQPQDGFFIRADLVEKFHPRHNPRQRPGCLTDGWGKISMGFPRGERLFNTREHITRYTQKPVHTWGHYETSHNFTCAIPLIIVRTSDSISVNCPECVQAWRQTIGPKSACLESGGGGCWLITAKFGLLCWRELMVSLDDSDSVQLGEHNEGSELCQGVSLTTWTMSPQNYFNSMLRKLGRRVLEYMPLGEIVHWLRR